MDTTSSENVESNEVNQLPDPSIVPPLLNQGGIESKAEFIEEEVRGALEPMASTGKFWCDWNHLRNLLSYKLKQVISEYPEASMSDEQQIFAIGETIPELLNRLDNELNNFIDGAPFTLQRICEIMLAAQGIYPKLSKLVLALEKNLLVSSTLAMSNDSPPSVVSNPRELNSVEPEKESEAGSLQPVSVANGVEPAVEEVKDEIMAEVEEGEADVNDDMTIDTEPLEAKTESTETRAESTEATELLEAKTEASNSVVNPNSNL